MLNKAAMPRVNNDFASVVFTKKKKGFRDNAKTMLVGLLGRQNFLINFIAVFLGRASIFGGLSPFALAYFVAIRALAPSKSPYIAIWAATGIWWGQGALPAIGFMLAVIIALGLEKTLSVRGRRSRLTWGWPSVAFLSSLAINIPWLVLESPRLYDMSILLIESGLIGVLVIIFVNSVKFVLNPGAERSVASDELVCLSILLAGSIIGLNGLGVGELSLKGIVIKYLVMFSAYAGGCHFAATMGVTVAMITNITEGIILPQVGLYGFAGLLSGLFKDYKKAGVIVGFGLGYSLLSFYYLGSSILIVGLQEIVLAGVLLLVTSRKLSGALETMVPGSITILGNKDKLISKVHSITSKQLGSFAEIFEKLADVFEDNRDSTYLEEENLTAMMEEICNRVCMNCPRRSLCWEEDFYMTYRALFDAVAFAEHNGSIAVVEMPNLVRDRCLHLNRLTEMLNKLLEVYQLNYYWQKQMQETKSLVGAQLAGIAKIVTDLTNDLRIDVDFQSDIEEHIISELQALNLPVTDVSVTKRENSDKISVQIKKKPCQNETQCTATIIPVVTAVLGKQVSRGGAHCASLCGKDECTLCLTTEQNYEVSCGIAQSIPSEKKVSGDSYSLAELPNGKFAFMLSDGMGSGHKARQESDITVNILESLLQSGFSKDVAVKTINTVLSLRSPDETFSTMDLALVDLYTAQAELIKIGASATFCKRGDSVECLPNSSLPMGILGEVIPDESKLQLAVGDTVIMASDGVLENQKDVVDKEAWLEKIIKNSVSNDPQEIASYILERAKNNCKHELIDDMTVIVFRLDRKTDGIISRTA